MSMIGQGRGRVGRWTRRRTLALGGVLTVLATTPAVVAAGTPATDDQVYVRDFLLEEGTDIAVGPDGSAYVTGWTAPTGFPTTEGAFDTTPNGKSDAFVARIDPTGRVVYATVLGGAYSDHGSALAVDASGAAFVVGSTESVNFPTTPGAIDNDYRSNLDTNVGFVAKVSPDGSHLEYATQLPGTRYVHGVDVDRQGRAHVVGEAYPDFVATANAFDRSYNAISFGVADGFLATLDAGGTDMVQGSFLGGTQHEVVSEIELGTDGSAFVSGTTSSSDFPSTAGSFDPTFNGYWNDVFVAKFTPDGDTLDWSTFVGGSSQVQEDLFGMAVRADGSVYLTGSTRSTDFPTTPDALFPTPVHHRLPDSFVARLSGDGSRLAFSTYLPAALREAAVDGDGDVHVVGTEPMASFPITDGPARTAPVAAELDAAGHLVTSFHLAQDPWDFTVDGAGTLYIIGQRLAPPSTAPTSVTLSDGWSSARKADRVAVARQPRGSVVRTATCTITGSPKADVLTGTHAPDVICAGAGNDVVRARGAHDIVRLGPGNDRADAGHGIDIVVAGTGNDRIRRSAQRDLVLAGPGRDHAAGGDGSDTLIGGPGRDFLSGMAGADAVNGGLRVDVVRGGAGHDRLTGGSGGDRLSGGPGPDRLKGNAGPDRLDGGMAHDICRGQLGRDYRSRCER